MESALNASFEVLSFGAVIVLVVLGLGVIAGMMGIFNFAHGEFVLLGTYALGLVIREGVRSLIGGLYLSVPEPIVGSLTIASVQLSRWRLAIVLITTAVMLTSYLLLVRTSFGLRVRAALENPSLARASGISTNALYAATFTFGAALAGLAGALVVPLFSLFADLGIRFLIQGFLAIMLGGIGTFAGSVLGAAAVGLLSAALPYAVAPMLADVLVFVIAIVFVKIQPRGLISGRRA